MSYLDEIYTGGFVTTYNSSPYVSVEDIIRENEHLIRDLSNVNTESNQNTYEYKTTTQVLKELYNIWDDIIEDEQNKILNEIAGERSVLPKIEKVIFNNPATVVCWSDNTKTVVKCQNGDTFTKDVGLAMCIAKKALGNKGCFNDIIKKWCDN